MINDGIRLDGKVAIVTGGGRGLGRAMTLSLVQAGANVVAAAHIEDDFAGLEEACGNYRGKVAPLRVDVRDPADGPRIVDFALKRFGALHVLVNNAGVGMLLVSETFNTIDTKFWDVKPETWRQIVETNFNGPYHMARAAAPHLVRQRWGRIINVTTSIHTMQRHGFTPYGPTKAALEAATHAWAGDLKDTGVTVNILIPGGAADTAFLPGKAGDKSRRGADGMLVDPEVMMAPIRFLASDLADGITGMRLIAREWDTNAPPIEAARKLIAPAGFAPRPKGGAAH